MKAARAGVAATPPRAQQPTRRSAGACARDADERFTEGKRRLYRLGPNWRLCAELRCSPLMGARRTRSKYRTNGATVTFFDGSRRVVTSVVLPPSLQSLPIPYTFAPLASTPCPLAASASAPPPGPLPPGAPCNSSSFCASSPCRGGFCCSLNAAGGGGSPQPKRAAV